MKAWTARIVLALFGIGMALIVGRDWGTNDRPLWMDLLVFIGMCVLFFVISGFIHTALAALDRKDDDR